MPPDLTTRPKTPPNGVDPSSGSYLWNGSGWTWTSYTGGKVSAASPGGSGGNTGISEGRVGGGILSADQQATANQVGENTRLDQAVQHQIAQNGNPYGNQYQSNLSYTPFGLGASGVGGGQYGLPSAFGGQSFNSDLLVPQLEQIRMQRLMQTYGGGGQ